MLRTLILAVAVLAAPLTTATAQASPGCAGYIKVCARPDAASTGGGGESPFYSAIRDPITHKPTGMTRCRSGCGHVAHGDLTLGD